MSDEDMKEYVNMTEIIEEKKIRKNSSTLEIIKCAICKCFAYEPVICGACETCIMCHSCF